MNNQVCVAEESRVTLNQVIDEVSGKVVGQEHVVKSIVIALLSGGHILLEGLPGTAKTRAVKSLSQSLNASFARVQFTPDLLPSDIIGNQILDSETKQLTFQSGPIFNSVLLADEINRAPAKVQAALLEGMAEGTVTSAGKTYALPEPFIVLATQNPIEQEGTYPLPEAQMDRFILKIEVAYPNRDAEIDILQLVRQEALVNDATKSEVPLGIGTEVLKDAITAVKHVYSSPIIDAYIADLIFATREPSQFEHSPLKDWIECGASPRASIALDNCSRALAWLQGRDYVTPDDVRVMFHSVVGHRIMLSYSAQSQSIGNKEVTYEILQVVKLG